MGDDKIPVPLTREVTKIDTRTQAIDMRKIENRRFLFNPYTAVLVLGRQYKETSIANASHAVELAEAGITKGFDEFVRGWIGTGGAYPHGVIHFAPHIDKQTPIARFNRAFATLEMFSTNGAYNQTVVRGFCEPWEQPLSAILSPEREAYKRPSVRAQLKETSVQTKTHQRKPAPGRER